MRVKGGLLSIVPQELLPDLEPLTSWPCPRHHGLAYQRWFRVAWGLGPSDAEHEAIVKNRLSPNEKCHDNINTSWKHLR